MLGKLFTAFQERVAHSSPASAQANAAACAAPSGSPRASTPIAAEVTGVELNPAEVLALPTLPVLPFVGLLLAAIAGWVGRP